MFRAALIFSALLLSLFACTAAEEETGDSGEDALVGGTEANAGDFPSTLLIRGNCTVSRVGPRHILTGAHCVYDELVANVRPEFLAGRKMFITQSRKASMFGAPEASGFKEVTIRATHVPGVYREQKISGTRVLNLEAAPDVAIMELEPSSEAALAGIPIASVDLTPVKTGDAVVIMGYGCEAGLNGGKDYSKQQLKTQKTKTLGLESQVHAGGFVLAADSSYGQRLGKQYLFTPGQGSKAEEASICPGDSGGPVYRDDGKQNLIVGVNAYYSFRPQADDPSAISLTNWHTRLDGDSRFDIGSWLVSLGVQTNGEADANHYRDCTTSARTGRSVCGAFAEAMAAGGGEDRFGAPTKEARFEQRSDGGWLWTQVFEGKEVWLTSAGVQSRDTTPANACVGKRDGHYCGSNFGDTDGRALYRCASGDVGERILCDRGCKSMPSGVPDTCAAPEVDPCKKASAGDGRYCGPSLDASSKVLYQCKAKATFSAVTCSKGCESMPRGVPDRCRP